MIHEIVKEFDASLTALRVTHDIHICYGVGLPLQTRLAKTTHQKKSKMLGKNSNLPRKEFELIL